MCKQDNVPSYLKLRPSSVDSDKLVNDRGDSVKKISDNTYKVNGDTCHGRREVADKVSKWR